MNDTLRPNASPGPGDDGLDPALIRLFDAADTPPDPEPFVSAVLVRLQAARRADLIRRCWSVALIMAAGAFLAPYVAQGTVTMASWIADRLPDVVLATASCACAALMAWRTARRRLR